MRHVECTRNVFVTQWFIQANDNDPELGPFRPNQLLDMVRDGEVTRHTKIRRDDETAWFTASDVGGLFEAAMRPTIQYLCPVCETEVGDPPNVCHHCGHKIRQAVTRITENTIIHREDQPQTEAPPPLNDAQRKKGRVSGQGDDSDGTDRPA
jgi:hypothetical protein